MATEGEDQRKKSEQDSIVHQKPSSSLLSRQIRAIGADAPSTKMLDMSGFKNLLILVLIVGNLRILWIDSNRYGFLATLKALGLTMTDFKRMMGIIIGNLLYMPVTLAIELFISSPRIALAMQFILALAGLLISSWLVYTKVSYHPILGTVGELNTIVTFLKIWSFGWENSALRINPRIYREISYPQNLTLKNLVYFWFAPTLIYQPIYPRNPYRRWNKVAALLVETSMGISGLWIMGTHVAVPILEDLLRNWHWHNWPKVAESYLSLMTAGLVIWLLIFFTLFQSSLNLIAEITLFADRCFYLDWWNASSVGTFWRDWNKPVSNMMRRNVYQPLRERGWGRNVSAYVVFFVSAILHEMWLGIATRNFNGVAFLCMMVQPVLMLLTRSLEKRRGPHSTLGNCVMWITIIFGQPLAVIIYYLQWQLLHNS